MIHYLKIPAQCIGSISLYICISFSWSSAGLLVNPTVKGLVLAGEGGLQGPSVVFQKPLQLPAAQRCQVVLHVACTAGVALGTDAKVLPCQQDGRKG